jgi:large subunit ribosomal protein L5
MQIKDKYNKKAIPEMQKKFGFKNVMQVPRIEKVVVNVGIGKFLKDGNQIQDIKESIRIITGQNPLMTKAKTSIAGFKTREGMEIGVKTTIRGKRKWDFLDRLVGAAIPRIRDFRGIKKSAIDARGNLNLGIKEHMIFPEILPEQVKNIFSLQVNVATTAKNHEEGLELFKQLGFPIEE